MKTFLRMSLLVGLGVSMVACGDDSGSSNNNDCSAGEVDCDGTCIPEADSTLAWVQSNVFAVHGCAVSSSCHNGQNINPLQDLDLSTEQTSFDSLVNVTSSQADPSVLVVPGDSGSSYLINKLTGQDMAEGTDLMPQLATEPLCDAKIDGVRAWIDDGANP